MPPILKRTPWAWTIATFFGVGNLRPGPGTYGSVAAMLLWMFAGRLIQPATYDHLSSVDVIPIAARTGTPIFIGLTLLAALLVTAIGIPASTIVAREADTDDPGFVVIDEVAGQLFALLALSPTWLHAILALLLFRLFDIWKPWPIRRLEQLRGGTGIMLDDVAAGLLAFLVVQILIRFVPALH